MLLWPLTMWYGIGVAVRNLLFDWGVRRSIRPSVPTVGIGNLRMGGTGKTPHTEYLIRLFAGRRVALLSRGYGRETKGFVLADEHSTAAQIGDEPLMMARKFPQLTVAVCEERVEGIERLSQLAPSPDVVLLDDVYQHRSIKPALNILLTEYGDPYFRDHILPFGNLREGRRGRKRADIVIVTKCPHLLDDDEQQQMRSNLQIGDKQRLFFSHIKYGAPVSLYEDTPYTECDEVVLVTGIAHPGPLVNYLEKKYKVHHLRFADHHSFKKKDYCRIIDTFDLIKSSRKVVITTEKDAARLMNCEARELLGKLPIFYIPIEVEIQNQTDLQKAVTEIIGQN